MEIAACAEKWLSILGCTDRGGMNLQKKYQVFISSTYTDLMEERQLIQEAILKSGNFPVGMEWFSANGEEQWETIRKTIDCSDYYILIVGYRYGTETGEGISYTQKEFAYALSKKIPILAFLRADGMAVEDYKIETRVKSKRKLQKFKEMIKNGRYVEWWNEKEDLIPKVVNALYKQFRDNPGIGWIREDSGDYSLQGGKMSWAEYAGLVHKLAKKILCSSGLGGFYFDVIVGISSGGLMVSDLLNRKSGRNKPVLCLNVDRRDNNVLNSTMGISNDYLIGVLQKTEIKNILLVESVSRKGQTILRAKAFLEQNLPGDKVIKTALLISDEAHDLSSVVDYIVETRDTTGLTFPYNEFDC